jgi:hypothetical protein
VVAHYDCRPSPVTGVFFDIKHPREQVLCSKLESLWEPPVFRRAHTWCKVENQGSHIRLWPVCSFEGKSTIRRRVCPSHQRTKDGRPDSRPARCLPSADGELSDCLPKRAQSPGRGHVLSRDERELHRTGGLMRLVLRVVDWYTSCSSSNLPSSECAGQDRQKCAAAPRQLVCISKVSSLIGPDQPRCAEFFPCESPSTPITSESNFRYGPRLSQNTEKRRSPAPTHGASTRGPRRAASKLSETKPTRVPTPGENTSELRQAFVSRLRPCL